MSTPTPASPPTAVSARFTMELEFVLCLAVPNYLLHLAHNFPHLLVPPDTQSLGANTSSDSDAIRFARYLKYLYEYWRKPEYAQFLTHPGTVLRNLELLQHEQFKNDLVNPEKRHHVAYQLELVDPPPAQAGGAVEVVVGEGGEEQAAVVS